MRQKDKKDVKPNREIWMLNLLRDNLQNSLPQLRHGAFDEVFECMECIL